MPAKVSVIIPVYNGQDFIADAVKTVRDQTFPCAELILVDDGSTDGSAEKLDDIPDARVIHQANSGPAVARNAGVGVASGEFIAFLDQDDLWAAKKTDKQLAVLENDQTLDYVLSHSIYKLHMITERPRWAKQKYFDEPVPGWVLGSTLIRRRTFDRVGGFDPALRHGGDDVDWFSRSETAGVNRLMMPDLLVYRRIHSKNLSAQTKEGNKELLSVIRNMVSQRRKASH